MRRIVLIIPELLSLEGPFLDRALPGLRSLAASSTLFRLSELEDVETPEARLLGLRPSNAMLRQGPLTVAALGADPPTRSLHFHLSLLSVVDETAAEPAPTPTEEELRLLLAASEKLNTRLLTIVAGSGLDHGLVWEALGDMETTPAAKILGENLKGHYPGGDGEPMLRRFVDDSVNLLSELEFNRRRVDEGQMPLNLLWPWGHGVRTPVPNLALNRASPAIVMSNSLRLAGLSRLAGYMHSKVGWLGYGLQTHLESAFAKSLSGPASIIVLDMVEGFRESGELDEEAYFMNRVDGEFLGRLLKHSAEEAVRVLLLAPSGAGLGLGLRFDSKALGSSIYPFDERSLEEKALPTLDLETTVDEFLRPDQVRKGA